MEPMDISITGLGDAPRLKAAPGAAPGAEQPGGGEHPAGGMLNMGDGGAGGGGHPMGGGILDLGEGAVGGGGMLDMRKGAAGGLLDVGEGAVGGGAHASSRRGMLDMAFLQISKCPPPP